MSQRIHLGRIPRSPEDRKALVAEEVAKEERLAAMGTPFLQKTIADFLIDRRGFRAEDIFTGREFVIELPECSFTVRVDLFVAIDDQPFMHVKCAMTSPDSWERYAVALGRVALDSLIPYAFITDGEHARLIDTRTGSTVSEGIEALPTREQALGMLQSVVNHRPAGTKKEREKRILHAFAGIACNPTPEP